MKALKIQFSTKNWWVLLFAIVAFSACQKEETEATLDDQEAIETVQNALSTETNGLASQAAEAAMIADYMVIKNPLCGLSFDTSVVYQSAVANRSYNYTYNWGWMLICDNNNIPSQLDFNYTMGGIYDIPRMSSDDDATHNFVLTNLHSDSTTWIYNGTYIRNGSQQSKIGKKNSFTSVINFASNNIRILKNSHKIKSGTATFSISGNVANGASFSHSGSIVFNGNNTATVTLANGNVYTIQL